MQKTENVKRTSTEKGEPDSTNLKIKETITDQNTGLQQLYENRKARPTTKRRSIAVDPKEVRKKAGEKLDNLLGKISKLKQTK